MDIYIIEVKLYSRANTYRVLMKNDLLDRAYKLYKRDGSFDEILYDPNYENLWNLLESPKHSFSNLKRLCVYLSKNKVNVRGLIYYCETDNTYYNPYKF